jgi:hypothetical protein
MKKNYFTLCMAIFAIARLDAATYQIASNLDNSFSTGTPPVFPPRWKRRLSVV